MRVPSIDPSEQGNGALSAREREIVLLVKRGYSNKEIAQALGISHWTVGTHLKRVFAKLGIGRRIEIWHVPDQ